MRYYIADLHFFHENMNTKMDCRGFDSIEDMHTFIIKSWNKKVRKNDEVKIIRKPGLEYLNYIMLMLQYEYQKGNFLHHGWVRGIRSVPTLYWER